MIKNKNLITRSLLVTCAFLTLPCHANEPTNVIKNMREQINAEFITDNVTDHKVESFKHFLESIHKTVLINKAAIQNDVNHDFDAKLEALGSSKTRYSIIFAPCLAFAGMLIASRIMNNNKRQNGGPAIVLLSIGAIYSGKNLYRINNSIAAVSTMKRSWNEFLANQKTNQ